MRQITIYNSSHSQPPSTHHRSFRTFPLFSFCFSLTSSRETKKRCRRPRKPFPVEWKCLSLLILCQILIFHHGTMDICSANYKMETWHNWNIDLIRLIERSLINARSGSFRLRCTYHKLIAWGTNTTSPIQYLYAAHNVIWTSARVHEEFVVFLIERA